MRHETRLSAFIAAAGVLLTLVQSPCKADDALARAGERLFFDKNLSSTGDVSCSTCHDPAHYFTDRRAISVGVLGQQGTRNAPSLLNVGFLTTMLWDGRSPSLEAQVETPLTNPIEHGLADRATVVQKVRANPTAARSLSEVFHVSPEQISFDHVARTLAAYQRTLISLGSTFDASQLPPAAARGLELFRGRAQCGSCHTLSGSPPLFTDQSFHSSPRPLPPSVTKNLSRLSTQISELRNTGRSAQLNQLVASDSQFAALGRFVVTLDPRDIGKFRTPSLRNVAETGPYMHDGSVATLEQAIDLELYGRGDVAYPIALTTEEKQELAAFLKALTTAR